MLRSDQNRDVQKRWRVYKELCKRSPRTPRRTDGRDQAGIPGQAAERYQKPEDLIGENGLLKQLTKALLERALSAELTHHLGFVVGDH